jgi:hypothetical protein
MMNEVISPKTKQDQIMDADLDPERVSEREEQSGPSANDKKQVVQVSQ